MFSGVTGMSHTVASIYSSAPAETIWYAFTYPTQLSNDTAKLIASATGKHFSAFEKKEYILDFIGLLVRSFSAQR